MVKPVIAVHYCIDGIDFDIVIKNLKEIKEVAKNMTDYYVFVLPTTKDSYIEAFYDKDFNEVKYEELSKQLMEEITKLNT